MLKIAKQVLEVVAQVAAVVTLEATQVVNRPFQLGTLRFESPKAFLSVLLSLAHDVLGFGPRLVHDLFALGLASLHVVIVQLLRHREHRCGRRRVGVSGSGNERA